MKKYVIVYHDESHYKFGLTDVNRVRSIVAKYPALELVVATFDKKSQYEKDSTYATTYKGCPGYGGEWLDVHAKSWLGL